MFKAGDLVQLNSYGQKWIAESSEQKTRGVDEDIAEYAWSNFGWEKTYLFWRCCNQQADQLIVILNKPISVADSSYEYIYCSSNDGLTGYLPVSFLRKV
jgi:hypothetical protein